MSASQPPTRYDGLDAVRAGAMLLGVVFHATWAYVPDIARWYFVEDLFTHAGFKALASVLHGFRMQVFFVLSGFFAHLVLERRGVRGFLVDRAKRIGVPLLVGAPLVVLVDFGTRGWSEAQHTFANDYVYGAGWLVRPLHLWFLELLFLFVLAAGLASALGAPGERLGRWLAVALRWPELLLLGAGFTGLALIRVGEPNPANSYVPQLASVLHFGPFFLLGWALWSARASVGPLLWRRWHLTGLGFVLSVWLYTRDLQYLPTGRWVSAVATWLLVLGLLGFAFAAPSTERPKLRFLVEASYTVYLLHYPLVLAGHLALARADLPAVVKYGLVVTGATALSFLGYVVLVRRTPLAPWLGGRRALPVDDETR